VRSDIVPGGTFPDYALPDHTGTVRTLSELQGRDPLILTLARGNYCPKEHRQHLELAENYPQIAVAYTQIATITTDDHHTLQEFRASVGAQWPFLSDPERPRGCARPGTPETTRGFTDGTGGPPGRRRPRMPSRPRDERGAHAGVRVARD
jgi:hypothetical protein